MTTSTSPWVDTGASDQEDGEDEGDQDDEDWEDDEDDEEEEEEDRIEWVPQLGVLMKERPDGSPLNWRSHHNMLGHPQWSIRETERSILSLDASHEIWSHLEPGDYISVFARARFGAWTCYGRRGMLLFGKGTDLL